MALLGVSFLVTPGGGGLQGQFDHGPRSVAFSIMEDKHLVFKCDLALV